MLEPKIVDLEETLIVGKSLQMSRIEDRTQELWASFMPLRKSIANKVDNNFYSIQVYPENEMVTPATVFTKWAGVAVRGEKVSEEKLNSMVIPAGKYAVFSHKGTIQKFIQNYQFIFQTWLPSSGYRIDNRPHFELLGEKYKGLNDPNSEEDIYIPIL